MEYPSRVEKTKLATNTGTITLPLFYKQKDLFMKYKYNANLIEKNPVISRNFPILCKFFAVCTIQHVMDRSEPVHFTLR